VARHVWVTTSKLTPVTKAAAIGQEGKADLKIRVKSVKIQRCGHDLQRIPSDNPLSLLAKDVLVAVGKAKPVVKRKKHDTRFWKFLERGILCDINKKSQPRDCGNLHAGRTLLLLAMEVLVDAGKVAHSRQSSGGGCCYNRFRMRDCKAKDVVLA
jgi:hypothetical protein